MTLKLIIFFPKNLDNAIQTSHEQFQDTTSQTHRQMNVRFHEAIQNLKKSIRNHLYENG